MMYGRDGYVYGVRSNGSSSEEYRVGSMAKDDEWVVDSKEEMNMNIDQMGRRIGDLNLRVGNADRSRRSERTLEWSSDEISEMARFRNTQRADVGGMRYSSSKYSEESPSSYQLGRNFDELKKIEYLEQDRAELLRKLDELKDQISRTNVDDKHKGRVPDRRAVHQDPYGGFEKDLLPDKHVEGPSYISHYPVEPSFMNSREMTVRRAYSPMHTPNQMQGFEDPIRSQMLWTPPLQAAYPLQRNPSHPYFSQQRMDNNMPNFNMLEPYPNNQDLHAVMLVPPSVYNDKRSSGILNKPLFHHYENRSVSGPEEYNSRYGSLPQRNYSNPQSNTRWNNDPNFEVSAISHQHPPRVVLTSGVRRCNPIARGAPFVSCCNCFQLLLLPQKVLYTQKSQRKIRCASCSKIIRLVISYNELVLSLYEEVKTTEAKVDDSTLTAKDGISNYHDNLNSGSVDSSSVDYDNSSYSFQSMDRKVTSPSTGQSSSADQSADIRSFHSTPYISANEGSTDILSTRKKEADSGELKSSPARPPPGSPLRDHINYSNRYDEFNHYENKSVMPEKESSVHSYTRTEAVVSELEISSHEYFNTGTTQDSVDASTEDQLRAKKVGEAYFARIFKQSFSDISISGQDIEQERANVTVNGHPIPDPLVKKAEHLAGPIQPGEYW